MDKLKFVSWYWDQLNVMFYFEMFCGWNDKYNEWMKYGSFFANA